MNEYKQQYIEHKNAVMDCLKEAIDFFERYDYLREMQACRHQLESIQNGEFTIVLVGEFSSGKSTLLNALMGDKLLPSFSNETTATVNFLRHKEKALHGEEGRVFYNDGTEKEIQTADYETIAKYVSTESDENVASKISHLDLYLDSKFLENNVTLVDSPGLNGVADGHREITEKQIEKSSAGIFVFDAHQPGSSSDFEFLKNLQMRVKGIICVLNQIDCIRETEGQTVESVIEKLKSNYRIKIPDAQTMPEIIPIAAYPALVARASAKMEYNGKMEFSDEEKEKFEEISRMQTFENRLWKYLTQGEKTKQMLLAPLDQLSAQIVAIKTNRKKELDLLEGKADENDLEEQKLELEKQLESLDADLSEKTKDINRELALAEKELTEEVNAEIERLKRNLSRKLDNWQEIEDIDTDKIEKEIERGLNRIAEDAVEHYVDSIRRIILETGNDVSDVINEKMENDSFVFNLENKVEKMDVQLGIDKYEKELAAKREELERLENESDTAETDLAMLMEKNRRCEVLKNEIEQKRNYRDHYEEVSNTMIPSINKYSKKEKQEIEEGGLFGGFKRFFKGPSYEWVEREVVDRSERDAYIRERNEKIANYDQEIFKLEKSLEREESEGVGNHVLVEKKMAQIERKKEQKREEIEALRASFREKNERQIAAGLKRQKAAMNEIIEDAGAVFNRQFKKKSVKMRKTAVEIMKEVVAGSVAEQIEKRKREIELLQEKMKTAVCDKENNIRQIEDEFKELDPILNKTVDLSCKLDGIPVDTIEEIAL